jgi:type II secretory pathway pseudopilin PulG
MPTGKSGHLHQRIRGFTLLAVLAAMFFLALATQKVMTVVSQQAQREREVELLHIGAAYARAIGDYYQSSPGSVKRWPSSLNDLTDDGRFISIRRHIRQVYADPISKSTDWGVVMAVDGGIKGVYSRSDAVPIRTGGVELLGLSLAPARRYSDWQFVYQPPLVAPSPTPKP